MKANISLGAIGKVRIEKWSKSRPKEVYEFPNVVLRVGLETYLDRSFATADSSRCSGGNSCFLGTGTTTPSLNDLGLEQVDSSTGKYRTLTTPLSGYQDTEIYYASSIRFRYDWGEGEAAGTWTELGLAFWDLINSGGASVRGNDNTYSFPFSRALIRDENANPISLTVLPDEYLRIFYTVIGYYDKSIAGSSVSFDGVPTAMTSVELSTNWLDINFSWMRFFHNSLPLHFCRLVNNFTGAGSGGETILNDSRSANPEGRAVTFGFNSPPGRRSLYHNIQPSPQSNGAGYIRFFFDDVEKPLVKNISGEATVNVTAKHWEVLLIGKVSSATATTLTMTGANWTPDQFAGMVAGIVAGTGWQSMSTIVSNTADTLTISPGWHTMPIEGSLFEIREYDYV